jgi:DNA/RNA endonuclease YhcR with UshA esterase domain
MMQKRKAIFLSGLVLFLVVMAAFTFYFINKPHTNVEGIKANVVISAENLYSQYKANEIEADKRYLNKVVEVTGEVAAITNSNHHYIITLKTKELGGINCEMMMKDTNSLLKIKENMIAVVKGRCIGFLADVDLVDCILAK